MQNNKASSEPVPSIVQAFLKHLRHVRRYSEHTALAYKNDLEQCAAFLKKEAPPMSLEQATQGALRAFILACMQQEMQPRTLNRKIATLKSFYTYLLRQDPTRGENPALFLKTIKPPSTLPAFAKEQDMYLLFDRVHFGDDYPGRRDKLVLLMLYGAGLRRAELLSLQEKDINLQHHTLHILGKRKKMRIIPIPESLCQELQTYIKVKRARFPYPTTSHLFLDNKGNPLYSMWLYRHVRKHLSHATQLQKKSPHVLRHSYATHLLNKGADINAIKALLGHSSLAATQVYTHTTLDRIKEIYKQAHPKA